MEKTLDYEASLSVIQEMVQKTKRNFQEGSFFYLIWGWLALGAAIAEYALMEWAQVDWHPIVWGVMGVTGGIASMVYSKKTDHKRGYTTYIDSAMKYIWLAFGAMMIISFVVAAKTSWSTGYALIIACYGMGTFISGGVLKFKPLIYGGVASWILCTVALLGGDMFSSFSTMLVMLMISITVSYLIPGYALKNTEIKNNAA